MCFSLNLKELSSVILCLSYSDYVVETLSNIFNYCFIEHRDKKGFTPLILAATAGHEKVVEILLTHGADIEAQSERTKDTPLSLACSGGRYEVIRYFIYIYIYIYIYKYIYIHTHTFINIRLVSELF